MALWLHPRRRQKSAAAGDPSLLHLTEEEAARIDRLIAAETTREKQA